MFFRHLSVVYHDKCRSFITLYVAFKATGAMPSLTVRTRFSKEELVVSASNIIEKALCLWLLSEYDLGQTDSCCGASSSHDRRYWFALMTFIGKRMRQRF
jgi:hypothetical protein